MKKIILFSLALAGTVSAWADYSQSDCAYFITEQNDVTTYFGEKGNTIETATKHMTVLVDAPVNDTIVIDGYNINNKNPEDKNGQTTDKNWSVVGVQSGVVILRNCSITNLLNGAGVQSYAKAKVILENCYIRINSYRSAAGYASAAIQLQGGKVEVISGTYTSPGAALLITTSGGEATIKGGTFISTATSDPWVYNSTGNYTGAIFCDKNGVVNMYDGKAEGTIYNRNESTTVNIQGGTFQEPNIIGGHANPAQVLGPVSKKSIFFDGNVYVDYAIDHLYYRTNEVGKYYTACFDRVPDSTNVTFYEVVYRLNDTAYCDEVALSEMKAGVPYIYNTDQDSAFFTFDISKKGEVAGSANGLVGSYTGINFDYTKGKGYDNGTIIDVNSEELYGFHTMDGKMFALCGYGAFVRTNSAYLKIDEISLEEVEKPEGKTRIAFKLDGEEPVPPTPPTSCKQVVTDGKAVKVMQDGQMFIRCNGKLINVLGRIID